MDYLTIQYAKRLTKFLIKTNYRKGIIFKMRYTGA